MKKERIGVLIGGRYAERDFSLTSEKNILAALIEVGYNALPIAAGEKLAQHLVDSRIAAAFTGLHGRLGKDGAVQGLLAVRRASYTGSGVPASGLSMNKVNSRQIFVTAGRPASRDMVLRSEKEAMAAKKIPFPLPVGLKPSREGLSGGVTIVFEAQPLPAVIGRAKGISFAHWVEEIFLGACLQIPVRPGRDSLEAQRV